jgi:uncharacterized protein (DUF39 family)
LYLGVGIPIPVLDEEIAAFCGVSDTEIETVVLDYSEPTRSRNPLRRVTYGELKSGKVEIKGRKVHTAPLSSYKVAREIADTLRSWVEKGDFKLSRPVEPLPEEGSLHTLDIRDRGGMVDG